MAGKSLTDIAYDIMSKKKRSIAFDKLWDDVSKIGKCTTDQIGTFYNDLVLDSRFVSLKDGKWDLKDRRKFAETFIDLSKLEDEEESEENDNEEDEELEPPFIGEDEY